MIKTENFNRVEVASVAELHAWLAAHHTQNESVWLVTYKKSVGDKYVSRDEVLGELLCFGWTDGVRRKLDETRTMQLVSPRRAQHWSKSYKDRAAELTRTGRMHPAGLEAIAESKRLGLWSFMEDVDALTVPDDLATALGAHPSASGNFAAFSVSSRRNTLRWLKLAKTPETRRKRTQKIAELAAQNKKLPGT